MSVSNKMENNINIEKPYPTSGVSNRFKWVDLEKHFTAPKILSPFYDDNIKIPRKLKKKVKSFCGLYWEGLNDAQRLWYYMEKNNNDYKSFLIKQICIKNEV